MNAKMNTPMPATSSPTSNARKGVNYWKTPKAFVLLLLLVLGGVGLGVHQDVNGLQNAGASIGIAVLLDVLFGWVQQRKNKLPDGAVLTGLIVAMVMSTTTPWYVVAATSAVGIVAKNLLRVKKRPLLNPAAFGLLLAILCLKSDQDWWGGMSTLPPWWTGLLVIAGLAITRKANKYVQVLTFLGLYFGVFLALPLAGISPDLAGDALRVPFVNSALFLGFIMLTDPPTSPGKALDQFWFGLIAAVVSIGLYLTLGGLAYLLIGLLVANLWNAWRLWKK